MVAPAASTEEPVVDAENIVSVRGLFKPKFVATKTITQIAATASAIRGGEKMILRFMIVCIMARPHPSQKQISKNISSQICEVRLLVAMMKDGLGDCGNEKGLLNPAAADN
jgi:hypothetical protein